MGICLALTYSDLVHTLHLCIMEKKPKVLYYNIYMYVYICLSYNISVPICPIKKGPHNSEGLPDECSRGPSSHDYRKQFCSTYICNCCVGLLYIYITVNIGI